jgi:hypothetical protein
MQCDAMRSCPFHAQEKTLAQKSRTQIREGVGKEVEGFETEKGKEDSLQSHQLVCDEEKEREARLYLKTDE